MKGKSDLYTGLAVGLAALGIFGGLALMVWAAKVEVTCQDVRIGLIRQLEGEQLIRALEAVNCKEE